MLQRKERGKCPQKGSGLVKPPSLLRQPHNHLQWFPKLQRIGPYPQGKAQICESTPWPGAGRMSGNLFEDRNWLLPPNYLNNNCKNTTSPKSPIKKNPRTGEESISLNAEKCGWGPNCPFCKNQEKIGMVNTKANFRRFHPHQKYKDPKQDALKP